MIPCYQKRQPYMFNFHFREQTKVILRICSFFIYNLKKNLLYVVFIVCALSEPGSALICGLYIPDFWALAIVFKLNISKSRRKYNLYRFMAPSFKF